MKYPFKATKQHRSSSFFWWI